MRIFTDNALHGRTLNPRDPTVTPGGSSGGAGAAIADRHRRRSPMATTSAARCASPPTATAWSACAPASPAFRPSIPSAAADGRPVGAVLMAVQGPHTRTVRDARLALEVMARGDRRDWRWNDVPMQGPPPARPIKVAIVPEFPGGKTHPAQAAAVRQAGKHLQAAGYVVEEILPPDLERGVELWHEICVTDVHRRPVAARCRRWAIPTASPRCAPGSTCTSRSISRPTSRALTEREGLLFRWMTFIQQWPLVDPADAGRPAAQAGDRHHPGRPGRRSSSRCAPALLAPLLGLPGLAVPVGSHGKLRTGVQIMAMRNREDLCLDAGEVIEAAEGVVTPIDPVKGAWSHRLACLRRHDLAEDAVLDAVARDGGAPCDHCQSGFQ